MFPIDITRKPVSTRRTDPYKGVVLVLLIASFAGMSFAIAGGIRLVSPALLATAVMLGIAAGILTGVAAAQSARLRPDGIEQKDPEVAVEEANDSLVEAESAISEEAKPEEAPKDIASKKKSREWVVPRLSSFEAIRTIRVGTAGLGIIAVLILLAQRTTPYSLSPLVASISAAVCLVAAALAFSAARYLDQVPSESFPEAIGLCRLARVIAWILVLAAVALFLAWVEPRKIPPVLFLLILTVNIAVCCNLLIAERPEHRSRKTFPVDLGVTSLMGSRPNILASVLDSAERQLGIDLRSTWALTVVRQGAEPLLAGLCLLAWLTTSFTVVGIDEQGLVERLGVPVRSDLLLPGLHVHWPWPVDRVIRIPVLHVESLSVGHEGEEKSGPEDVLWAVQHAANEYTLLLGNGRDLITIDAAVQFRIRDPRLWIYHTQNPADALRAIAYRAVMRSTVNLTLSEALSENVVKLTADMRRMVQQEADRLGLGVEVIAFTIGGMHPPVAVASDYQAVVSAEVGKVTSIVNAQTYRNQNLPAAEASALTSINTAQGEGAEQIARATGEAWSFRTIATQYQTAREEYLFRRRLEALEKSLSGRRFTVVDSRIQRDGGELWLMP